MDKLESRNVDGHELLHRIQLCEGKLNNVTTSKLNPFDQLDIQSRLSKLERLLDEQKVPPLNLCDTAEEVKRISNGCVNEIKPEAEVQKKQPLVCVLQLLNPCY